MATAVSVMLMMLSFAWTMPLALVSMPMFLVACVLMANVLLVSVMMLM